MCDHAHHSQCLRYSVVPGRCRRGKIIKYTQTYSIESSLFSPRIPKRIEEKWKRVVLLNKVTMVRCSNEGWHRVAWCFPPSTKAPPWSASLRATKIGTVRTVSIKHIHVVCAPRFTDFTSVNLLSVMVLPARGFQNTLLDVDVQVDNWPHWLYTFLLLSLNLFTLCRILSFPFQQSDSSVCGLKDSTFLIPHRTQWQLFYRICRTWTGYLYLWHQSKVKVVDFWPSSYVENVPQIM